MHCMIQKDSLPYITCLCIVQLYAADFNTVLKYILSRKMMTHNRDHGVTSPQLFAQKTKSTYDTLITSCSIYDMARVRRENLVSVFNNLKGCYDRIRPSLNSITTRRMGLPAEHAICHARVLRQMRHQIRTGFGISEDYIEWSEEENIGGIGQGNGGGPPSWHSHMLLLEIAY